MSCSKLISTCDCTFCEASLECQRACDELTFVPWPELPPPVISEGRNITLTLHPLVDPMNIDIFFKRVDRYKAYTNAIIAHWRVCKHVGCCFPDTIYDYANSPDGRVKNPTDRCAYAQCPSPWCGCSPERCPADWPQFCTGPSRYVRSRPLSVSPPYLSLNFSNRFSVLSDVEEEDDDNPVIIITPPTPPRPRKGRTFRQRTRASQYISDDEFHPTAPIPVTIEQPAPRDEEVVRESNSRAQYSYLICRMHTAKRFAQSGTIDLEAEIYRKQRNIALRELKKEKQKLAILLNKRNAHLQRELELEKRKRNAIRVAGRDAKAQVLENVYALPGNLNNTLGDVSNASNSVTSFVTRLEQMITSFVSSLSLPSGTDIWQCVLSIISIVTAYTSRSTLALAAGFASLARAFGLELCKITDAIWGWIHNFIGRDQIHAIQSGATGVHPQYPSAQFDWNCMFTTDYTWLFGCVLTVCSMLIRGTGVNYSNIMSSLANFGRAAIGFTNLKKLVDWVIHFCKNEYYMFTTGKTYQQVTLERTYPELEELLRRVHLIKGMDQKFIDQDKEVCEIIVNTYNALHDIRMQALRAQDKEIAQFLGIHISSIAKNFTHAQNSPAFVVNVRTLPGTLYMCGKAGVGKSVLCQYLEGKIYSSFLKDKGWSITDYVFTRNAENEFWDGYHGQPIVKYDDFLQQKDSATKPNLEIMETIRIVNEAAFHLHMAELSEKKNVYFDSQFVIANSNIKKPDIKSIACPDAFMRRWKTCIEVRVNPAFGVKPVGCDYYKIDDAKLVAHRTANNMEPGSFVKDIYLIDTYDMATGNVLQADMSVDTFWTHLHTSFCKSEQHSSSLRKSILDNIGLTAPSDPRALGAFKDKLKTPVAQGDNFYSPQGSTTTEVPSLDLGLTEEEAEWADMEDLAGEPVDSILATLTYVNSRRLRAEPYTLTEAVRWLAMAEDNPLLDASFIRLAGEHRRRCTQTPQVKINTPTRVLAERLQRYADTPRDAAAPPSYNDVCAEDALTMFLTNSTCGPELEYPDFLERTEQRIIAATNFMQTSMAWVYTRAVNFSRSLLSKVRPVISRVCHSFISFVKFIASSLSPTHLLNVLWIVGFAKYYECVRDLFVSCAIRKAETFYDLCRATPCKFGCTFCNYTYRKGFTRPLGSDEHGIGLCKTLAHTYPKEGKWALMYLDNAKRVYMESKETNTRVGPRNVFTESKELSTRLGKFQKFAENGRTVAQMNHYENGQLVAQVSDTVQLEQWESVNLKNAVRIGCCQDTSTFGMNAIFVSGRTLLLPHHFIRSCKKDSILFISNPYSTDQHTMIPFELCKWTQLLDRFGHAVDLAYMTLPNTVPSRRDIRSCFVPATQLDNLKEGQIVFAGMRRLSEYLVHHTFTTNNFYCGIEKNFTYEHPNDPMFKARVFSYLGYDIDTKPGDCGGLIYCKNKLISGKIIGMHVAGCSGFGFAAALSREFIERNFDIHIKAHNIDVRGYVDARIPYAEGTNTEELPRDSLTMLGDCLSLGTSQQPRSSSKTQLAPSLIAGLVTLPTTKPAYLRPGTVNGKEIDPMRQGIKKVLGTVPPVNNFVLNLAVNSVKQKLYTYHQRFVLTYEQAIEGCGGGEFMKPINRTTSPGYPYCLNNPGTGKQHWFGKDDTYLFSPEIKQDVETLLDHCRNGRRGDVVFIATLKDERRPIEKVNAGKTRVFEAAPQHFVIAIRMYFLCFVNAVMESRIENEIAVGTNVYNLDWHRIGTALSKMGSNIIAGDYSNFDGSLNQEILWQVLEIINDWYDDSDENKLIRTVLWEEICNSRVLVDGEIIQQTHSQPSGNPLTVIINSIYNQIVTRMAYLYCKAHHGLPWVCDFDEHVSAQFFGDDNVLNVSDEVESWFNHYTLTDALSFLGLTYTNETKTEEKTPFRSLDQVAFLKRRFVRDENGYFRAPLDLDVVKEMANWIRGKAKIASTIENVETSLRELALHGKDEYDKTSRLLLNACRSRNLKPNVPTYEEWMSMFDSEFF